jgi:hypothetical protein
MRHFPCPLLSVFLDRPPPHKPQVTHRELMKLLTENIHVCLCKVALRPRFGVARGCTWVLPATTNCSREASMEEWKSMHSTRARRCTDVVCACPQKAQNTHMVGTHGDARLEPLQGVVWCTGLASYRCRSGGWAVRWMGRKLSAGCDGASGKRSDVWQGNVEPPEEGGSHKDIVRGHHAVRDRWDISPGWTRPACVLATYIYCR